VEFDPADAGHTLPLANHLGFDGVLAQIAALTPALLTLTIYGWIAYRLRCRAEVVRTGRTTPAAAYLWWNKG